MQICDDRRIAHRDKYANSTIRLSAVHNHTNWRDREKKKLGGIRNQLREDRHSAERQTDGVGRTQTWKPREGWKVDEGENEERN